MIGTKFAPNWLTKLLASSGLLSLIAVMPAIAADMASMAEEAAAPAETSNVMLYTAIAIGAALLLLFIFKSSDDDNTPSFAARCGPMWGSSISRKVPPAVTYYEPASGTAATPSSSSGPAFAARCGAMWATPTSRNA